MCDEDSRGQIVEDGAAEPLIKLLLENTDNTVLGNASAALANLAHHEGSRSTLVVSGCVRPLAALCSKSQDVKVGPSRPPKHTLTALPKVLGNAAGALANLAHDPDSRGQVTVCYSVVRVNLTRLARAGDSVIKCS
jgi:hypothetical protein